MIKKKHMCWRLTFNVHELNWTYFYEDVKRLRHNFLKVDTDFPLLVTELPGIFYILPYRLIAIYINWGTNQMKHK